MFRPAVISARRFTPAVRSRLFAPRCHGPRALIYQRARRPRTTGPSAGRSRPRRPRHRFDRTIRPGGHPPDRTLQDGLQAGAAHFAQPSQIPEEASGGPSAASRSMGTHVRCLHIPSSHGAPSRRRLVTRIRVSRRRARSGLDTVKTTHPRAREPSPPRPACTAVRATCSRHRRRVPQAKRRAGAAAVRHRTRSAVLRRICPPHHRSGRTGCWRGPPAPRRSVLPIAVTSTRGPRTRTPATTTAAASQPTDQATAPPAQPIGTPPQLTERPGATARAPQATERPGATGRAPRATKRPGTTGRALQATKRLDTTGRAPQATKRPGTTGRAPQPTNAFGGQCRARHRRPA
jgi:hypothetical protein